MVSELQTRFPVRAAAQERNRDALLRAAAELAVERGYDRTSLDAVAARAGLTKGAIYSIFGSKPALFHALLLPRYAIFGFSEVAEPGTPLRDVLAAYGRRWAEVMGDATIRATVVLTLEITLDAMRDERAFDDVTRVTRLAFAERAEELERYAALAGERLPRPAEEMVTAMLGSLQGLSLLAGTGLVPVPEHLYVDTLLGQLG